MIKNYSFFAIILLVSFGHDAHAQYDILLHHPYAEEIAPLKNLYAELMQLDSAAAYAKSQKIKDFAYDHSDESLALEMNLFWGDYLADKCESYQKSLELLTNTTAQATKKEYLPIAIRAHKKQASIYWYDLEDYVNAFVHFREMAKLLKQVTSLSYPDKVLDLKMIGKAYYAFKDYKGAIRYLNVAAVIHETVYNSWDLADVMNTLGLCYQKLKKYKQANEWFTRIDSLENDSTKKAWLTKTRGNMGQSFYQLGQYQKAIPLLKEDYKHAEKKKNWKRSAAALISLAEINLKRNNLLTVKEYLQKARRYISISEASNQLRLWYPVMSKWCSAKGQFTNATLYLDSTIVSIKNYDAKYNSLKSIKAQQRINMQHQQLGRTRLIAENNSVTARNNLWIGAFIFVLLLLLFLHYRQYRSMSKRQLQLKNAKLSLRESQQKIEKASIELENFTKEVVRKNQIIQDLKKDAQAISCSVRLETLRQQSILTEEDWEQFKHLFEKAYPGFMGKVKDRYPQITPSLLRYLTLSKLKLSNKEMGHMLGISSNSLQVTRYRLVKKLNLSSENPVEDLLNDLS